MVGIFLQIFTAWKVSKYGVFSGPYFPVLGLNTEIYCVNLRIKLEYGKIQTRKTPYLDTFLSVFELCFRAPLVSRYLLNFVANNQKAFINTAKHISLKY